MVGRVKKPLLGKVWGAATLAEEGRDQPNPPSPLFSRQWEGKKRSYLGKMGRAYEQVDAMEDTIYISIYEIK